MVEDGRVPKAVKRVRHVDERNGHPRVPLARTLLDVGAKAEHVTVARVAGTEAVLRQVN